MVVGLGGVGGWAVEALARSGVGTLTLVDLDEICVSNRNRQVHALVGQEGRLKTEALAERISRINPDCEVKLENRFMTANSVDAILGDEDGRATAVIDAIDVVKHKMILLLACRERGIPLVVSGAAGGRRDSTQVRSGDLSRTENDPILATMRKQLRQKHGFPRVGKGRFGIRCIYSLEPPIYPTEDGEVSCKADSRTGLRLNCDFGYGSATPVVAAFGMAAAAEVLAEIVRE